MILYCNIMFVEEEADEASTSGGEGGEAILSAACFRLGVLGARVTRSFSERMDGTGLTPKQMGLLAVVDAGTTRSQREIAFRMHVAPSLVVSLVDRLVDLGAVRRVRSPTDRRARTIEITAEGRRLLARGIDAAREVDDELRAGLSPAGRSALETFLIESAELIVPTQPVDSARAVGSADPSSGS